MNNLITYKGIYYMIIIKSIYKILLMKLGLILNKTISLIIN